MPASLAVCAHWSVSTLVARKNETSPIPGVHSLPENVLNDQQMNIPHFNPLSFSACAGFALADRAANAAMIVRTHFFICISFC